MREGQKDWEHIGRMPNLGLGVGETFLEGGIIKRSLKNKLGR